jgi:hypothetical protein
MITENTKILRINAISDKLSPIECMFNLEKYSLLAVGRADHTIEIWDTRNWVQLYKLYGSSTNQIRRVFLIKKNQTDNLFDNLRLFSIGLNGYLIEWSLIEMKPKVYKLF